MSSRCLLHQLAEKSVATFGRDIPNNLPSPPFDGQNACNMPLMAVKTSVDITRYVITFPM